MKSNDNQDLIHGWRALSRIHLSIMSSLEGVLQTKHQLSVSEFTVLLALAETPEKKMRIQQLADEVGLSQSAMSRLVARLEADNCGVLQRYVCEADRRGVWIRMTEKGLQRYDDVSSTFQETIIQAFRKEEIEKDLAIMSNTLQKDS
ncbi:MarR family winged helix-turn-helix transcriptional regulator [Brevibacillus sp. 179-C 1.1 NHS]|uniref:MarR family winged helix-turn-helix transcriptional regulator n=1 Tax=Brevibacillus sp. 179-C 1.1 NHS TaxID=3235177 RepID=UPI0039A1B187